MLYFSILRYKDALDNPNSSADLLMFWLFFANTLSMVFFYTAKYEVPKFIRWVIVVFVLSNGFITQMAVFAGAFDIAMDFRKLRRPRSSSGGDNTDPGE